MAADLIVFGPHPDDIEIGLGGTVAREAAAGRRVGLCDLTAGELSSNGTPARRRQEAEAAAEALGAAWRVCLEWPDGGIAPVDEQVRPAIDLIREHRPRAVAIPYWVDRHPDHVAASRVLDSVVFKSGLARVETGHEPWRPDWTCYYFINDGARPSFVVDVSDFYGQKLAALDCYASQFAPSGPDAASTRLTAPTFRQLITSRDEQFGALAGVRHAEGLVVRQPVVRSTLMRTDT